MKNVEQLDSECGGFVASGWTPPPRFESYVRMPQAFHSNDIYVTIFEWYGHI